MYILYTTTKNGKLFFASITEPDTTKHVKCQYKKRGPLSCGNIRSITWSKVVFSCRAPDQYISIRSPIDVNRTMGRSGKPGKRSQMGKNRSQIGKKRSQIGKNAHKLAKNVQNTEPKLNILKTKKQSHTHSCTKVTSRLL